MDMDSVPPATMTSAEPERMRSAARAIGLQTGRAEAVDGHRARFDREAGAKGGDARDVHALFAFGHGAAENYVIDFFGVEAGNTGERFLDGQCGEIVGARGAQGAFVGAADGSADSGDDDGFGHGGPRKTKSLRPEGLSYSFIVGREWGKSNSW